MEIPQLIRVKEITTLFVLAVVVSMVIMQPLQTASAIQVNQVFDEKWEERQQNAGPTSTDPNINSFFCQLGAATPYYLLNFKLGKKTDKDGKFELDNDGNKITELQNKPDRGGTFQKFLNKFIDIDIELGPLQQIIDFVDSLEGLIEAAKWGKLIYSIFTGGILAVVNFIAAKIAFFAARGLVSLCPPIVVQANWQSGTSISIDAGGEGGIGGSVSIDSPSNFFKKAQIPDTHFDNDPTFCSRQLNININALEQDGKNLKFDPATSWGDLTAHPATEHIPDFEELVGWVIWDNNISTIAQVNPEKTAATFAVGENKIDYQAKIGAFYAQNTASQKVIVNDVEPPVLTHTGKVFTLQPIFPDGALVPANLEQLIKDAIIADDNCGADQVTKRTDLFDSDGGHLSVNGRLRTGVQEIALTATDAAGNTSDPMFVVVEVKDTLPPEILQVFPLGVYIPEGETKFDPANLKKYCEDRNIIHCPPPVFDLATYNPQVECFVGTEPNLEACDVASDLFPSGNPHTITWVAKDPSGNLGVGIVQTVNVKVEGDNTDPEAFSSTVYVALNKPTTITLMAQDEDGDGLEYSLIQQPGSGNIEQQTGSVFTQRFSLTGTLSDPTDMIIKHSNIKDSLVFVSDAQTNQIFELTTTGDLVNIFSTGDYSPDSFVAENPWVPQDDNVIKIADFGQKKIIEYEIIRDQVNGDYIRDSNKIDFSDLGLVNPHSVYEQKDPDNNGIEEGLIFIDQENGGLAVFTQNDNNVLYQVAESQYSANSAIFGNNTILMPGAYGVNDQFPELTPFGAVITDWENRKITINSSPVFHPSADPNVLVFDGGVWQADISNLFNKPEGAGLPPLVEPVAIAMSNNHYTQQKYFSHNFQDGKRSATYSYVDSPYQVIFELGQQVTVSQIEVGLLNLFNQYKSYTKVSEGGNRYDNPIPAEQQIPHNEKTWNAVSQLTIFAWNEITNEWEAISKVAPTTPYPDSFTEKSEYTHYTIDCYKRTKEISKCNRFNIQVCGSGSCDWTIYEYINKQYQEEVYALNFPTTTSSRFMLQAEPVVPGHGVYLSEFRGKPDLKTSGTPELDNGPYRTTILDKVTGKLVNVEIGSSSPNSAENTGGTDRNPYFSELFGLHFVDIKDIDTDSKGNLYVIDDQYISKFNLAGVLQDRLNFDILWGKPTIGHQLHIDNKDVLHFTMQDSEVYDKTVDPSIFEPLVVKALPAPTCGSDQIPITEEIDGVEEVVSCVTCPTDYYYDSLNDICNLPNALNVEYTTDFTKIGDIRPIFEENLGKLVYDSSGPITTVFSQGKLEKFDLDDGDDGELLFTSIASIDISECTDTGVLVGGIDACDVMDSAIDSATDSKGNYFLLTPHSVWKYDNDGNFVKKMPGIDLDFGFRMQIDNNNNFYIIEGTTDGSKPSMKKFDKDGDLISLLSTDKLLENFSVNSEKYDFIDKDPDPNNLRITSFYDGLRDMFFVSEGPPLYRIHVFQTTLGEEVIYTGTGLTGRSPDTFSFSVSDSFAQSQTAFVTVNVIIDEEPPQIKPKVDDVSSIFPDFTQTSGTCMPDAEFEINTEGGINTVGHTLLADNIAVLEAVDNADPEPIITNDMPDFLTLGQNTITFTARDASDNDSSCTWNLFVHDTTPPTITPPDDIVRPVQGISTPVSELGTPLVEDFDPDVTVTNDAPSKFPVRNSTITWTATDSSGNSETAEQQVFIFDADPPTFDTPADIYIDATNGYANLLSYVIPPASDLGGIQTQTQCSPEPDTLLPIGGYQVSCVAIDKSGNAKVDSFFVSVSTADKDGDGIADMVDKSVDQASNEFSDSNLQGITSGSIIQTGDQTLDIFDDTDQESGVRIMTMYGGSGVDDDFDGMTDEDGPDGIDNDGDFLVDEDPGTVIGSIPAEISICNDDASIFLDEGEAVIVTCGSVSIKSVFDSVEIAFTTKGQPITTTLDAEESMTYDSKSLSITAGADTEAVLFVGTDEYPIKTDQTIELTQQDVRDTGPSDADGDGVADNKDGCPNDPNKTEPGIGGCAVSDADTDGDGTIDVQDNCPNDPNKIEPGLAGCGVSDADTDGDGTIDAQESCPADPNKTEPGFAGCGEFEPITDSVSLEMFAIGTDNQVYHKTPTTSGSWFDWPSLGGDYSDIEVAENADGTLQLFAVGTDGALYHKSQTASGWSDWQKLGLYAADDQVVVGQNQDGRLEVFGIGSDNALYHIPQTAPNGGWSDWSGLGGWVSEIEVARNGDGRLEVFAIGSDNGLYHMWQTAPNAGWSGWSGLGGGIIEIEVVHNVNGQLEVFAIGTDNALYHMWQGGNCADAWSCWAGLQGWIDDMEVVKFSDGQAHVFAIGSDDAMYQRWHTAAGWQGWLSHGGELSSLEKVVLNENGGLDIFAIDKNNLSIYKSWSAVDGWSDWSNLGWDYSVIEVVLQDKGPVTRSSFAIGSIGQIPMRGGELDSESTLNVGGPKNAGLDTGPRAMGTFLSEISSDLVCGDTLCDEPLSMEEKIEMYLKNRGLETPSRHQVS